MDELRRFTKTREKDKTKLQKSNMELAEIVMGEHYYYYYYYYYYYHY